MYQPSKARIWYTEFLGYIICTDGVLFKKNSIKINYISLKLSLQWTVNWLEFKLCVH